MEAGVPDPKKIISMAEGALVGTLWTVERECGWAGCDSWRTLGVDLIEGNAECAIEMSYAVCLKHLPVFLDGKVLRNMGTLLAPADEPEYEAELEVEPE